MEPENLLSLMGARRGHFVFESGYHGDLWLDLDGMFAAPSQLDSMLDDLSRRIAAVGPDVVCGPMTGGALVAFAVGTRSLPAVRSRRAHRSWLSWPTGERTAHGDSTRKAIGDR